MEGEHFFVAHNLIPFNHVQFLHLEDSRVSARLNDRQQSARVGRGDEVVFGFEFWKVFFLYDVLSFLL